MKSAGGRLVLRASSLSQFADCPRRWAARSLSDEISGAGYTLRPESRGVGAAVGTAIHEAARITLTEKAVSGSLPPESVATDAAADIVREEIARGVMFDQRVTPNATDASAQAVRMSRLYHRVIAPEINSILIERRLEADVSWSVSHITVSGQPDVVAQEPGMIVDLKGGARLGYNAPQIGAYSLIVRANNITEVERGRIDWIQRTSMKKVQADPVAQKLDIGQAEQIATNVLAHIDRAVSTFRGGDPERRLLPGDSSAFLSNPASMLCSGTYCRAHSCGSKGWCTDYARNVE